MSVSIATSKLVAFHSDPAIKAKYLARIEAHRKADELVQGYGYWEDGKGCAVGCTIHGSAHSQYESKLGIPKSIALLEDSMFEGLPIEDARVWPGRFLEAIPVGADLSLVANRFLLWLLESPEIGLLRIADDEGKQAILRVAELHRRAVDGDRPPSEEWAAAWAAAWDAALDAARAWKTMSEQLLILLTEAPTS